MKIRRLSHFIGFNERSALNRNLACLLLIATSQAGCRVADLSGASSHPFAGKQAVSNVSVYREDNANQSRSTAASNALPSQHAAIYPISRTIQPNGVTTASHQSHGPQCQGACCRTASYTPMYPELENGNSFCGPYCGPDFGMMGGPGCSPCPPTLPRHIDPNEYVYDGGDREPEARLRDDLSLVGLDSEDTVIRYETQSGSVELKSGCRVPVYSPRFAATRKIRSVGYQDHAVAAKANIVQQAPAPVKDVLPPTNVRLKETPVRDQSVKVVEAFRDRRRGLDFAKALPAIDISDAFKPFEDLGIIREGKMIADDRVKLRRFTAAAMQWSKIENLQVIVETQSCSLMEESSHPEETLVYELAGKPRVRLCKVASHQVAEPGDVIDFTIRFDNVGDQKISNIAVHDSLSPRLEYVEDSQKCSLKASFENKPNDAGSSALSWTIDETVEPGQGGFIRFQCKVR
jgi:uncharacterized repeat protein (TIGR01451 family)